MGSRLFAFSDSGFAKIIGRIFSKRVKTPGNKKLLASRYITSADVSLPVDVRRSKKKPLLKLPTSQQIETRCRPFVLDRILNILFEFHSIRSSQYRLVNILRSVNGAFNS